MPTLCVQHPFGWFPTDLVSFLDAVLPGRLSGLLYTNHRRFPLLFLRRGINGGLLPSSLLELISLRIPWVQALPTHAKPVTTWRIRDEAFANIAEGITKVIQQAQREGKYPVQTYGLAFDYYTYMGVQQEEITELERAMCQKAEQWLVAIQDTGGILQEVEPETRWDDRLFTCVICQTL